MDDWNEFERPELPDIDIARTVSAGRREARRAKLTIAAVALILAVVIGIAAVQGARHNKQLEAERDEKYQMALSAMDNGLYGAACELLEDLGDRPEFEELREDAAFAKEFTRSDVYDYYRDLVRENVLAPMSENDYGDSGFTYDARVRVVELYSEMPETFPTVMTSGSVLEAWQNMTSIFNELLLNMRDDFVENGYDVDCLLRLYGSDGDLLYSSNNGVAAYGYADSAAA